MVHSFSRFFRDQFRLELYVRRLAILGNADAMSSVWVHRLFGLPRVWRCHSDEPHHSLILVTQDVAVEHKSSRYIATKMQDQPNLAGRHWVVL